MRLAYIGNFIPPFSTENDLVWTLEDLGHEVLKFQEDMSQTDFIYQDIIDREIPLLIYGHTHTWVTHGSFSMDELLNRLHEKGVATASFHLDYWRGLDREVDVNNHAFWHTKYVFTADGGSNEWYRDQGINHFWLPPGVVKRDCYWANPKEEFLYDVIFVGSYNYHAEWPYRPQLIDWLHNTYGNRFAHYGNDGIKVVRGTDLNRLYRSAKIVVGDSLCLNFNHNNYWSDRVPETMGRGGFLIHPFIEGLQDFYIGDEDIVYYKYGDFIELKSKIVYYLENYIDREEIRLSGHEKTKEDNTYTERMQTMLAVISREEGWEND